PDDVRQRDAAHERAVGPVDDRERVSGPELPLGGGDCQLILLPREGPVLQRPDRLVRLEELLVALKERDVLIGVGRREGAYRRDAPREACLHPRRSNRRAALSASRLFSVASRRAKRAFSFAASARARASSASFISSFARASASSARRSACSAVACSLSDSFCSCALFF